MTTAMSMNIDAKFSTFKEKYLLTDEAIEELKSIFDTYIVEIAHKIINAEPKKTMPKLVTSVANVNTEKKFATKIAEEYAAECGVTLEEIPCESGKVTKKEIEKYTKNKSATKSGSKSSSGSKEPVSKEPIVKEPGSKKTPAIKEKCSGVTKDGNPCNAAATKTPEGSKKCYCFRHAIDWKQFEISSDSDSENEIDTKKIELESEPDD
jgi:hypothetical protein